VRSVLRFGRLVLAGAVALAFSVSAQAAPPIGPKTLDLDDGYNFLLLGAGDTKARVGNPKSIYLNVAVSDDKIIPDRKRLIEASDRVFESVLMNAAEKGYYKRAVVNVRKPGTDTFEDFLYLRGENEVWLRQAGQDSWKVAQDPKAWIIPPSEKIEIEKFGAFQVETSVEIEPPAGFTRAAEIDFVTKTPLIDVQRKYQEIKALWARMDRAQMRADGFDLIMFGNFTTPQLGRFHARRGFYVRIPRDAKGDWPELPDRAPDNRDMLISKAPNADAAVQQIAYQFTFTGPLASLKLSDFIMPGFKRGATPEGAFANVGFGYSAPSFQLAPVRLLDFNALAVKIE
jgi:hypothetical protein